MLIHDFVTLQRSRRKRRASGWEPPDSRSTRRCTKVSDLCDKRPTSNKQLCSTLFKTRWSGEILSNCFKIGCTRIVIRELKGTNLKWNLNYSERSRTRMSWEQIMGIKRGARVGWPFATLGIPNSLSREKDKWLDFSEKRSELFRLMSADDDNVVAHKLRSSLARLHEIIVGTDFHNF